MKNSGGQKNTYRTVKYVTKKDNYIPKEGAWKLAYADFVTAMMCFFMLMWLLNATPSQRLKSMAMYFKPTIGFFNENSINNDETTRKNNAKSDEDGGGAKNNTSTEMLSNVEAKVMADFTDDAYMQEFSSNISTAINSDGLEISIFDNNKKPMFKKSSSQLTDEAKLIIDKITRSIMYLPNRIVIGGYTERMDGQSISGYNGWDLSAARAESAMKTMQISGLPIERVAKLVAYSDNVPFDDNDPYSPRNRRITITLLTKWSTVQYKNPISNSAIALNK